ncbi:MAG: hypothetical protein K0R00_2935 [Herbinix sp.]|jgi:hypothetical protein|nr:hypothetical protein [Herbinix sp.]
MWGESLDFLNIFKNFESGLGDDIADSDEIVSGIVIELKKYDVYDIIAKIAGLNLVSENQNKSILLDAIIAELLCIEHKETLDSYKISSGKFRKLMLQVNNSPLCMMIDPNENTFVQNVMFHKDYTVFNGIDQTPAYNLQNLIKILFECKNEFSNEFLMKIHKLCSFILEISDSIAEKANVNFGNTISNNERLLIIPAAEKVQEYSQTITIDGDYFDKFFNDMDTGDLFSDFGSEERGSIDHRPFYARPFLRNKKDNSIIILNISLLPTFAFYITIKIAESYEIKEELINLYHKYTWRECRKYLSNLGHYKIVESEQSIEIFNNSFLKEMIVTVYNDQLMLVIYLADDGEDYNEKSMHQYYPSKKHQELLNERLKYFMKKFKEIKVLPEHVILMLIVSGFGRGMGMGISKSPSEYDSLKFTPIELKCVSIMERKVSGFLPRYVRAKSKFHSFGIEMFSELNSISIYTSNNYSFYMSDDINSSNLNMFMAPGDSIYYIKDALIKEDRKRILSYEDDIYAEVIANDKTRNIYVDEAVIESRKSAHAICFESCVIWATSDEIKKPEELNIYYSIIDAITFWLAECKDAIESMRFLHDVYQFNISISGKCVEYYYDIQEEREISELITIDKNDNHINVIITPGLFRKLNKSDNSAEKELCRFFIQILSEFSLVIIDYDLYIEKVFKNIWKKKILSLDYNSKPYLKPFELTNYIFIHGEDEDHLADLIGKQMIQSRKWTFGVIPSESRGAVSNYIVGILYSMLQEEVSKLSPKYVAESIYLDLEKTLYRLMLARERYIFDVSCYPEKKEEILSDYNSDNKTSISLKFLMEYIAAKPPEGTKILGEGEYEYILAICSMIIDWAYKNDLFHYNIFNTPVEILKSERVGMKQKEFADMFQYGDLYRQDKLNYISSAPFRKEYNHEKNDYEQDLDEAFKSERGYTYKKFVRVIFEIVAIGNSLEGDVFIKDKIDLISTLTKQIDDISEEEVKRIVSDITITSRQDFLRLPSNYRKEDVYPWRFNRAYSFNRRPMIERGTDLIWGNRQLYHMVRYVNELIYGGTYSTKDKKMGTLIGKISNERGKLFNETIVWILRDMKVFDVYPNLKKINKKPISDENGDTLGDIDILFIDVEKQRIYVTEVKSFSFSRNPYEIQSEYNKIFVDTEQHKCFVTKHNRRIEWVEKHLQDTCEQFELNSKINWKIVGAFIVEEPIISNKIYNKNMEMISQLELTIERIRKIK